MGAILLLILKIIGYGLLGIILIIIGLILTVLFNPIKYRFEGRYYDETLKGKGKISWFFRILTIHVVQEEEITDVAIRIVGKRINKVKIDDEEVKEEVIRKAKATHAEQAKKIAEEVLEKEDEKLPKEDIKTEPQEVIEEKEVIVQQTVEPPPEEIKRAKKVVGKDEVKEKAPKIKKQDLKVKPDEIKKKKTKKKRIKTEKEKKESKWKLIKKRWSEIKAFLSDEENKKTIKKIWQSIKYMVKKTIPKNIRLYLQVGTGDPASTGYLLGLLSFLYTLKGRDIIIEGNFDDKIIKGEVKVKGRIYLIVYVKTMVKLMLDKNFRKFIVLVKNN